jgi:hypothetical protein
MNLWNIVAVFSVVFVMANALYVFGRNVTNYIFSLKSENGNITREEIEALEKQNSIYRLKIKQLEENNEHLSIKLKGVQ